MSLHISSAPHIRSKDTTQRLMLDVIIALLPTTLAGIYLYGLNAALILALSVITAVVAEFVWQKLAKRPVRINDCSAIVTGLIMGLNLPPTAPWWLPVIGSAIAIILVKELFGGIGDNFINPALAARGILLASWSARMTSYYLPTCFSGVDAVSTATPLSVDVASNATPVQGTEYLDAFLGNMGGTIGEVCKLAILIGLIYLLIRKTISWRIPVVFLAVTALCCWMFGPEGNFTFDGDPLLTILTGGVMFGAVFMASDYTTSPMTPKGQIIYAAGCGLIVAIIRTYGSYPEGVTYAILLMNIVTPLIDKFVRPRVYGKGKVKANA